MAHPDTSSVLARLGEPIGDAAALRVRLVPELKRLLDEGRAAAEAHLLREQDGLACVRLLADLMDEVVRLTYDAVLRHLYPANNPSSSERLAVAATGGYGRGTMAPRSGVGLLFFFSYKQTAWGESVVEGVLFVFLGLKVKGGHAAPSGGDC